MSPIPFSSGQSHFPSISKGKGYKRPTPAKGCVLPRPDARPSFPKPSMALRHGLDALLSFQASPRLREIHLELEHFEGNVDAELRPKIALLREQFALVSRVDERGNPVAVELQPPGRERVWSGEVASDEDGLSSSPGEVIQKRRIVEVVWKVERVREEDERDLKVDVPDLEFSDADREPSWQMAPENAEAKRQWEERLEREESLLRFIE